MDDKNRKEKAGKLKKAGENVANIAGKENGDKIKKGGIRLTGKIVGMVAAIIAVIAVSILIIVLININ